MSLFRDLRLDDQGDTWHFRADFSCAAHSQVGRAAPVPRVT